VSTGLNSLAAIWYAELSGTRFRDGPHNGGRMVKGLAFVFGLLSFVLVFAVPYMGGLAPVGIALNSFFSGTIFGLFMLGMFVPFANSIVSTQRKFCIFHETSLLYAVPYPFDSI